MGQKNQPEASWLKKRRIVEKKIPFQEDTEWIGMVRERKVNRALTELKNEGKIIDFVPTGRLSYADLMKGIDFAFSAIADKRHVFMVFSVTGKKWVESHLLKHPLVPVVAVELDEEISSVKRKILDLKRTVS